jgi:hypothetical protein
MQIVIDVPQKLVYEGFERPFTEEEKNFLIKAIGNGIPLPGRHGRLGDLDALETEMENGIRAGNYEEGYEKFAHINNMDDCVDCVRYADTIIEADKE